MSTPTYTTVAFDVELLPDEGECLPCSFIPLSMELTPAKFQVRNHDGKVAVSVCEYHLSDLMMAWDFWTTETP